MSFFFSFFIHFGLVASATTMDAVDPASSLSSILHLQQMMQGAATSRKGEATSRRMPNPAKMPMTWARCQSTETREWPNLPLHLPES
jgi:hypothetical protein